ncbi:NAD-dependent epimerase [Aquimarina agarivorans]|uniref:NAD-dependent epimerase n=1 Tax=Aquimarina agarivorans TaxID=980584 RepID=UPI000248E8BB|nr:NAD-dependent epimerase [Aquimarina agarivorans]
MKILVSGAAGFIGFHTVIKLIKEDHQVVGFDNLNDYYDVSLKLDRLKEIGIATERLSYNNFLTSEKHQSYKFIKLDLTDKKALNQLFKNEKFDVVINLAAQAGVRYSLINPDAYIQSNINGFLNLLEACRHNPVKHLIYASSSSVYGSNKKTPFSVDDNVDHPVSLYAATKKSNELMAHTYSHLYKIPVTGLRFFTVYGPWGRPDMAPSLFADAILNDKPINVFNNGDMERDFTYVDDIVEGISRLSAKPPIANENGVTYALHNIGNSAPVRLMDFISCIEKELNTTAKKNFMPMQPGDVKQTYANVSSLSDLINYKPSTTLKEGVGKFIEWFKGYHKS